MRVFLALSVILWGLHDTTAVMHSWKAFYTGSTGMNEFPEFVAVNVLDDKVMGYFDSRTNRFEGKQSWVMENLGQEYVDRQTDTLRGWVPTFKANVGTAMQRFNQSKGVHINQVMYGCEWDDETQEVTGYERHGFDGEDWLAFDQKTETWIAPASQAVITKHKWDNNKAKIAQDKNYFTQQCPVWLKKYVEYGRSSLMRTDPPSVSLLQKTPSSPVSCHATGFYPDKAVMFWRKNGEELHEDVDQGEILPNHDGSFQKTIHLSSVKHEDWGNCECVFQLSGLEDDIFTRLEKSKIKTNESSYTLIIVIVVAAVLALVIGAIGFFVYRQRNAKRPPSPMPKQDPEVKEMLNPTPTV